MLTGRSSPSDGGSNEIPVAGRSIAIGVGAVTGVALLVLLAVGHERGAGSEQTGDRSGMVPVPAGPFLTEANPSPSPYAMFQVLEFETAASLRAAQAQLIADLVGLEEGMWIADIGSAICDHGRLVWQPVVGPTGRVYCVDVDASCIRYVEQWCDRRGCPSVTAVRSFFDDTTLPPDSFDRIVSVQTIGIVIADDRRSDEAHLQQLVVPLLSSMARALKPEGVLYFLDGSLDQPGDGDAAVGFTELLHRLCAQAGLVPVRQSPRSFHVNLSPYVAYRRSGQPVEALAGPHLAVDFVPTSSPKGTTVPAMDGPAPLHTRSVEGYYIDVTEVTNADYLAFVRGTGYRVTGQWSAEGAERHPDTPAVRLTFADAAAFADWAGKRLPTEDEWEKAARGTDGRLYPWGNGWEPHHGDGFEDRPRDVGTSTSGVSPFGVEDMAGNVSEFVVGRDGRPVIRGGNFAYPSGGARTSFRFELNVLDRGSALIGFRCVTSE